jgi:hypothetical protein
MRNVGRYHYGPPAPVAPLDEDSCVECGARIIKQYVETFGTGVFGPDGHGEEQQTGTLYECENGHAHDEYVTGELREEAGR